MDRERSGDSGGSELDCHDRKQKQNERQKENSLCVKLQVRAVVVAVVVVVGGPTAEKHAIDNT